MCSNSTFGVELLYELCLILTHTVYQYTMSHESVPFVACLLFMKMLVVITFAPQVLWVGIVPAMHLTAFCGFRLLTGGQSNE